MNPTLVFFLMLVAFGAGFAFSWYAQSRKLTQRKIDPADDIPDYVPPALPRGEVNPRVIRTLHEDCICGAKPNQWCFHGCAALDPWDYR